MSDKDNDFLILKNYIKSGWPDSSKQIQTSLRCYYSLLERLCTDELLFLDHRIIQFSLRQKILSLLPESLMDIGKSNLRALQTVYWPGINKKIEEMLVSVGRVKYIAIII